MRHDEYTKHEIPSDKHMPLAYGEVAWTGEAKMKPLEMLVYFLACCAACGLIIYAIKLVL